MPWGVRRCIVSVRVGCNLSASTVCGTDSDIKRSSCSVVQPGLKSVTLEGSLADNLGCSVGV